ncbi:MAG: radical SAM protein [Chloroflexi bacterium]|nr:radical SAM protein [Chloroflexota bacterium]
MSNLVVSRVCNMNCPYCFAGGFMQSGMQADNQGFISRADFSARLDYLKRSGIDSVRLIGGEPTLHPQIRELIEEGRRAGMQILIFTHGILKESLLAYLENLPGEECTLLVNMNTRGKDESRSGEIDKKRRKTLERLGHLAAASFNIHTPNFDLLPVMETLQKAGCRRIIRLGLAHPSLGGQNVHLHPKCYPHAAARIAGFAETARGYGIRFEFDCGFVRCMFSDDELAALKQAGSEVNFQCSPILDVDLNGDACHCFPLADRFSVQMEADSNASDLRDKLIEQTRHYRAAGIYPTCSSCGFKIRGECTGGCLAAAMRRFRPANIQNVRLVSIPSA